MFDVDGWKAAGLVGMNTAVTCEPAGRNAMSKAWPSVTGTGLPMLMFPSLNCDGSDRIALVAYGRHPRVADHQDPLGRQS